MPLLPSLIRKIDHFCKIADYYNLMSVGAPDDRALYAELQTAASESVNPDVSYNLKILAAMYQKALELNGGFNTLNLIIQNMLQDLDPEEEESDNVENLLNQISNSIAARASRPDSPGVVRELQMAGSAVRSEIAPITSDEDEPAPEDDEEMSAYEASVLGYSGAQEEGSEKDEMAKFLPGGATPEVTGKRGWGVGKAHTYKDWAALYETEREKYQRDMEGPDTMLTKAARDARKNATVMTNLRILVDTLVKLEALTKEAVKLEHQIMIETEVPHPKEEARLAAIREELRKLEHNRGLLKRNLKKVYKTSELETLRKEQASPGKSDREKLLLQEKIKLQELRLSDAYGYGKEAKERQRLIDALTADPNLPVAEIKKKMEAIDAATAFTNRVTKAQYDRKRTEQRGKEEGREYIPTAEPMRGGGRYKKQIDFDTATYPALLKRFRELNNTITSDAKKYVARSGKERGDDRMIPYVEAVSSAIRKKDQAAKFTAINALKEAIKQTLVADASLRGYLWSIRLAPHFKNIEEFLYNIKTKQDAGGTWNLSESEKDMLRAAATQINRMYDIYTRYFPEKGGRYGRSHYMTSVKFYPTLINYIYNNILQEEPPSLEATAQNIPGGFKTMQDWLDAKRKYDRDRFEQKTHQEGRVTPLPAQSFRGGHRPKADRNLDQLTLAGLARLFGEKVNTASNTVRDYVAHPKAKGDPALKPYVSALSKAIIKGDKETKHLMIRELQSAIEQTMVSDGALRQLIRYYRLVPHLLKLREALAKMDEGNSEQANAFISQANRILDIYEQHFTENKSFTSLAVPMELLAYITNRIGDKS